jgi:hypothetical protein
VTTRPHPEKAEVERIIRLIIARHEKHNDRNLERMPTDLDDAAAMVRFLRRYDGPHLPKDVRRTDGLDVQTLNNFRWWELQSDEKWAIDLTLAMGEYLATVGAQLGVGKQGLRSRRERLEALLLFDRPDELRLRERRRNEAADDQARDARETWLRENHEQLHAVVAGLLTQAARHNPERLEPVAGEDEDAYAERWEWLDWLAEIARDDAFTPESMTVLSQATAEVRRSPGVLALTGPRPYKVHEVLIAADRLLADFAGLGKRAAAAAREAQSRETT